MRIQEEVYGDTDERDWLKYLRKCVQLEDEKQHLHCCGNCEHYKPNVYSEDICLHRLNDNLLETLKNTQGNSECVYWEQRDETQNTLQHRESSGDIPSRSQDHQDVD